MWNIEIVKQGTEQEAITATVEFYRGDKANAETDPNFESVTRNFSVNTAAQLDAKIMQFKAILENRDSEAEKVSVGAWTPPTAPEKTPEQIAAEQWVEKWKEYSAANRGMKALEEAGITPTAEETAAFEALKTWVAENRKPEYTHLI